MSQFFISGGENSGASASASVLPMKHYVTGGHDEFGGSWLHFEGLVRVSSRSFWSWLFGAAALHGQSPAFLTEVSPQPAPALDSILNLSGCGHLYPSEGCPWGPWREAWLCSGWFRIDSTFRGPTVGGPSCHPHPTVLQLHSLPGEGPCQSATAAVTKSLCPGAAFQHLSTQRRRAGRGPSSQETCRHGSSIFLDHTTIHVITF